MISLFRRFADWKRYASSMARIVLLAVLGFVGLRPLYASQVTYATTRRFIEERCATNTTPQEERIFVRVLTTGCVSIIQFHKGITLREIIDQTSFKGHTVWVCVLRTDHPVLDHKTRVGSKEKPKDEVKPQDVILLDDHREIINV